MAAEKLTTHAVILAGGRGTRFWPRSRMRTPKQLLNIVGEDTMLEQTVARLRPLVPSERIWTVTNREQAAGVAKQVPALARQRILTEPIGRNTAAAIALAAIHVRHAARGDALMAVLPADHYIANPERYRVIVKAALEMAADRKKMVVLGIPPTRPDTGFGYIERTGNALDSNGFPVYAVRRFTAKPALALAKEYAGSGLYHWNAGMFFWRVSTFLDNLENYLPKTYSALETLAETIGKKTYDKSLRDIYPTLENISVDYAVLEPATREQGNPRVFVIPAEVGWSDIGSWAAVYELLAKRPGENIFANDGSGQAIDAEGNFFYSPKKFVAAIGIKDLVIVETADALLICPRERAQDVGKIVKKLEEAKRENLL
jgi:mannose-1-phosphate guanylyltransferase